MEIGVITFVQNLIDQDNASMPIGGWANWEIAIVAAAMGVVVGLLLRLKPSS